MTIDRQQFDALDPNAKRELLARMLRNKAAGVGETIELSLGQEALFFLNQLSPQSASYNVAFCGRIRAQVDSDRLEAALLKLLERHTLLRCTFPSSAGKQKQRVNPVPSCCLEVLDASQWSEEELKAQVSESYRRPFDLSEGPLFRALLFTRNDADHLLLITVHHIVFDATSLGIILSDLALLYDQGPVASLPALTGSYGDFVKWQREMVDSDEGRDAWESWRSKLSGYLTPVDLPGDRTRPSVQSFSGATHSFELAAGMCQELRALARAENATPYMVLATAFHAVLCRYSGAAEVPIAMPLSGRGRQEFENTVGYFVNPVVLCAPIDPGATFRQHLATMRETVIEAQRNGDFPFPELVKRLQPERDTSRSPLCQVMLNLVKTTQIGATGAVSDAEHRVQMRLGSLPLENFPLDQQEGQFDLDLGLLDTGGGMPASLKYSTDLFDSDRIERMAGHFVTLLAAAIADPGQRISDLPMLTEAERARILEDWNAAAKPHPFAPIHRLVEDQVKRNSVATALVFEGRSMSYGELNRRANQLAHYLRGLGIGPDMLVAISVERSFEMVVGLLGILKAGGAYVPVDPDYPVDRQAYMIEDSRAPVLLTQSKLAEGMKNSGSRLVLLDSDWDEIAQLSADSAGLPAAGSDSRAYVLYTSGSTGKPKGVEISHKAIVNFLLSMQREPGFTADDILLAVTTLSFDIAGLELYLPLITGGRVVIASREDAHDPSRLMKHLRDTGCTVMQATPTTWRGLIQAGWTGTPNLKLLCGGETMPRDLAEELLSRCGELWNMYGPTETTVWSTVHKVTSGAGSVPIGHPIANTQLYILDAQRGLIPQGVSGELYIGGVGLARGYLHRAELTQERFVPSPFERGARLYRTGDLARWLPDGTVECLGRVDNQVKIRGFRIELGEIEARLGEFPDVRQAAVIAREDTPGDKRLVAYYTASQSDISSEALRTHLSASLPDYMVPAAYMHMDALPQTPNGKLDRKALPAPEVGAFSTREYEPPQTDTEIKMAAIWADVLKLEQVGRRDNFFELGGHSLMAVQVVTRLRQTLCREVEIRDLFVHPELADLSRALETAAQAVLQPIKRAPRNNDALSPAPHMVMAIGPKGPVVAPQNNAVGRNDLEIKKVIE